MESKSYITKVSIVGHAASGASTDWKEIYWMIELDRKKTEESTVDHGGGECE